MTSRNDTTVSPDSGVPLVPLSEQDLSEILCGVRRARVAVLGDYCLDVYWMIDLARSEPSLETGVATHPVREQGYALGGAGNVVNNIVAIGCPNVCALGVVGDDPWGRELVRLLDSAGVDTMDMLVQHDDWATLAYTKPHIEKQEGNRLDFGNYNRLSPETASNLLARVRKRVGEVDIIVVNQQVREGVHSEAFREGLLAVIKENADRTILVDSRHYSAFYANASLKINDHEAARLCGRKDGPDVLVLREEAFQSAHTLFAGSGKPVFVTRGSRGIIARDATGLTEVPGVQVLGAIDSVGAGDSVLAGISLSLAAGYSAATAAQFGNLVAAVTIQKLRQTGTASPEEIVAMGRDCDYIYAPELAEDPRRARYIPATEIERIGRLPEGFRIRHAIFDHDGTISTLREGWEQVMEPMMVRSVLGARYASADESLYHRVVERVREYIDKSTGIQTLAQMQGLVELIRESGCVPEAEILDAFGYKAIYNEALMGQVRVRTAKLENGELAVEDFSLKNAVAFVSRLHRAGVRLYLASGTDEEDVKSEARAMGYEHLFDGGIYGSVGDVTKEAKRIVLERILREVGPGAVGGLATFGDGPVEIRETRKRGGLTIGIASDEIRRFGLNLSKRARLIKAGADLVIPDFSQMEAVLRLLGVSAA